MRIIALLLLLFLMACGEPKLVVNQIGAITHTQYWVTEPLRWEGASRHYEYDELCSAKLTKCIRGRHLLKSEFKSSVAGKLAVTFLEDVGDTRPGSKKPHSYLLNTISGAEIKCENCKMDNRYFGQGRWLRNGSVLVPFGYKLKIEPVLTHLGQQKQEKYSLYFIEFWSNNDVSVARERYVNFISFKESKNYGLSFSPSLNTFASFDCAPRCVIQWLNEDLTGYKSKPIGCASGKLFIVWKGDEPEAVFSNWAQAKDICLDKNGKPMFRQLSHDEEMTLRRAQP
jgi:hypothetical protein